MRPLAPLLVAVACLLAWQQCDAVQLQDTKYAMTFHVQKDQFDQALEETSELLKIAEEKKMSKNTIMFLRAARDKVQSTLDELKVKQKQEIAAQERAKNVAPPPASFTEKDISVKPLKGDGAKKCNMKQYEATEVAALLKEGKIDLRKPFIIHNGVTDLAQMKKEFTAGDLMKKDGVTLRYLSPVKAKEARTFDQQQSNVPEDERLEYSLVTVEKYFINCFNHKAKPDFRKNGGADTEHCEQSVPAAVLHHNMSSYVFESTAQSLGYLQQLDVGRNEFLSHSGELQGLVNEKADVRASLSRGASRYFVFGPAGSGEQLRQEGVPFLDGLVHGKRRWFLMAPKDFQKLREVAKDTLEPASAFMYFEQQMEELVEEHGLGGKKMKFWECNQNPGDVIYIPGDTIVTSLSMKDSFSLKHHVASKPDEVLAKVNQGIWAPDTGMVPFAYQFAACFDPMDLSIAGSKLNEPINPMQGQIIGQIMGQYYPTTESRNLLIMNVLSECTAVFKAKSLDSKKTHCPKVWEDCVRTLEKNAKSAGKSAPAWLSSTPPSAGKAEL